MINDRGEIIAINLSSVFNVAYSFLEALRTSKDRIVTMGSIQSFVHVRTPRRSSI